MLMPLAIGMTLFLPGMSSPGFEHDGQDGPAGDFGTGRVALVIGIDRYANRGIEPLRGCVADARKFALLLERTFGFEKSMIDLLLDEEATRERIEQSLERLSGRSAPGDLVVIYFAGYGSFTADSPDPYGESGRVEEADWVDEAIVPWDVLPGNAETPVALATLRAGMIRDDLLKKIQFDLAGRRIWIVLDSSHQHSELRSDAVRSRGLDIPRIARMPESFKGKNRARHLEVPQDGFDLFGLTVLTSAAMAGQDAHESTDAESSWGSFTAGLVHSLPSTLRERRSWIDLRRDIDRAMRGSLDKHSRASPQEAYLSGPPWILHAPAADFIGFAHGGVGLLLEMAALGRNRRDFSMTLESTIESNDDPDETEESAPEVVEQIVITSSRAGYLTLLAVDEEDDIFRLVPWSEDRYEFINERPDSYEALDPETMRERIEMIAHRMSSPGASLKIDKGGDLIIPISDLRLERVKIRFLVAFISHRPWEREEIASRNRGDGQRGTFGVYWKLSETERNVLDRSNYGWLARTHGMPDPDFDSDEATWSAAWLGLGLDIDENRRRFSVPRRR